MQTTVIPNMFADYLIDRLLNRLRLTFAASLVLMCVSRCGCARLAAPVRAALVALLFVWLLCYAYTYELAVLCEGSLIFSFFKFVL